MTRRVRAYRRGRRGELLAGLALMFKGYRILARRYRTPVGEIDLIAKRGSVIAFVEVKARRSLQIAADSIPRATQRRIMNAGDVWLSRHPDANGLSLRFDVIYILPWRLPRHIPNAFGPEP